MEHITEEHKIQILPKEILLKILNYLEDEDLFRIRFVNSYFYEVYRDDYLWQQRTIRRYGCQENPYTNLTWKQVYSSLRDNEFIMEILKLFRSLRTYRWGDEYEYINSIFRKHQCTLQLDSRGRYVQGSIFISLRLLKDLLYAPHNLDVVDDDQTYHDDVNNLLFKYGYPIRYTYYKNTKIYRWEYISIC